MVRRLLGGLMVGVFALAAFSCSGKSEEEAMTYCDQQKAALASQGCITDAVYNQCIDCYEDCGDSCRYNDNCMTAAFACQ